MTHKRHVATPPFDQLLTRSRLWRRGLDVGHACCNALNYCCFCGTGVVPVGPMPVVRMMTSASFAKAPSAAVPCWITPAGQLCADPLQTFHDLADDEMEAKPDRDSTPGVWGRADAGAL